MDASMTEEGSDPIAVQALDTLLMVMLERLVRAYGREYVARILNPLAPVDRRVVAQLLMELMALEHGSAPDSLHEGIERYRQAA